MMITMNDPQRNVGRIDDLPYHTSPPIQFVYTSTATLAAGVYTWTDGTNPLTPTRPLVQNSLYYFRNISLSADTEELDFSANIVTTNIPKFYMFQKSKSGAILFREPLLMPTFLRMFEYKIVVTAPLVSDAFLAAFRGSINQGPAFIGKNTITLTAIISAQEIVDEGFIKLFTKKFPDGRF